MTTTTFEAELASNQPNNIFKALGGIIYEAATSVAIPASFTSGANADMVTINAANWHRLGLLTKGDGVTFSRDLNTDEEEAWGYNEPVRTDITTDVTSAAFTLMEQNRYALQMYDFVDLSSVTPDATTGEWAYNKPLQSAITYRRILYLAVDGAGTDRRYRVKIMPRAQVVGVNDEVWSQGGSTKFPVQIRATVDTALGYSVRNVFAGPGQKSRNSGAFIGP
jgi:hypothetical protein